MPGRAGTSEAGGGQAPIEQEFSFTDQDFKAICVLIHDYAGISLSSIKRNMVYSRLARRLRTLGLRTFADYLAFLDAGHEDERQIFVNSLTTNLTYFFREPHHFEVLARHLADRRHRQYRIWCAAASTGEEAYSLAITACEVFSSLAPPVSILASDIDTHVLAVAARGAYPVQRVERLSAERLQRYFFKEPGGDCDQVRVRPELQRLVSYRQINLLDRRLPVEGNFDAIFCRNVMIYFDKPTQYTLLQKLKPLLREDGLLFAGHAESFMHAGDIFRPLGRTVYMRADSRAGGGTESLGGQSSGSVSS
ncbi:chemotaxis protein CheR [Denitratisoma sp. DHT3]|uniref:CheR family methyltransferase n=1 Tax=Denitratisoma sp. DHT3 TaxID=1981880 RepID=UPI001198316F|nr:CheR family methyltransferase [Denitratisoma sp. DHT3]QDX81382.1 chemotaxis protein CheR [Denitratisoma sp. DHT3]